MPDHFPCPACGAPNDPEAGASQMTCSYCGANLIIPASMRRAAPKAERPPAPAASAPAPEIDASELLRKAQPVATQAWNAYASWTWIRRALPACLIIALIGVCACAALAIAPFLLQR